MVNLIYTEWEILIDRNTCMFVPSLGVSWAFELVIYLNLFILNGNPDWPKL